MIENNNNNTPFASLVVEALNSSKLVERNYANASTRYLFVSPRRNAHPNIYKITARNHKLNVHFEYCSCANHHFMICGGRDGWVEARVVGREDGRVWVSTCNL